MVKLNFPLTTSKPCVLVIDDEEAVRLSLRAILQNDYEVLEAESADRAFELLKKQRPDLITLDIRMPGRGGLEALRLIRESDEFCQTPVILITGHASLDGACEALRLGATDYLQKPFAIDQLKTSIRKGLRQHEAVRLPNWGEGSASAKSASENLERLGRASAAFVHDLASPLQVLTLLNSLCLANVSSASAQDREVVDALEQMSGLLAWASELLRSWNTIAIPTQLARESIDAHSLLERVVEVVQPYARINKVALTLHPPREKFSVVGDRVQLERALVNTSLNGIKASTARARTLELSAHTLGDHHVFRCADSGRGFTYERMREVLDGDPFATPGKTRRGLGLFIADWVAVNHGGKLQFICEEGLGTTVELFIPNPVAVRNGTH